MGELKKLPNIGEKLEQQLQAVGISTLEDLQSCGAEAAWLRILQIDESACLHRLLALEGALQGVKKSLLPAERKAELRAFCNSHKI